MKQSETFLQGEGDAMFQRTGGKAERWPDPVIQAMDACALMPQFVLEVGCGNGWRLNAIEGRAGYGLNHPRQVLGFDASAKAVEKKIVENVFQGDALSSLAAQKDSSFDLIIFGFCLYLIDRQDLLMIAAHTDRILQDGGHIIIIDFYHKGKPFAVPYKHKPGVLSYHMDHSMLWLGHPGYKTVLANYGYYADDGSVVTVLKKDFANAFPERKI